MKIWTTEEEAANLKARFLKINRAAFARDNGLIGGQAMIYQHITARRPIGLDAAVVYARGFGCRLDEISPRLAKETINAANQMDLGAVTAKKEEINLENNPDFPAIRRVNLRLSAGITGFSVDYEDGEGDMIVFKRRWYDAHGYRPDNLIAIRVHGQSMESGLHQGDTVVVNTEDTTPKDGDVFAVNYEGEAIIKRLVRDRGEWWLSSDNVDQVRYPRKVCSGDACIIIGKIVHKQSERI